MLITRSVLLQMGSIRAEKKCIGGGFQIMYVCIWICCNFIIQRTISLFGGKHWVKHVIVWGICFTKFPLAISIHIWQLSLASKIKGLEFFFCNFLENMNFVETKVLQPRANKFLPKRDFFYTFLFVSIKLYFFKLTIWLNLW